MNVNFNAKPINFKMSEYMSKGFELLKKDFGNILVALLCCIVMSIIPFCGLLGVGNFYKYLRKVNKGQLASPGEIFNFDNFTPYFILQLIMIGGFLVFYIPMIIFFPAILMFQGDHSDAAPLSMLFFIPYFIVFYVVIVYFLLKGFYIPALISFKGITDIKTAWNASRVMTKNNLLSIFLFSFVLGILSQLGIILCGIGIFLTMPFLYTSKYFAFEHAMQQIEYDEITEIGIQEKY
ncbi:hypothetical protein N0B16_09445 [Chryseobacterium sp. GMJ5]|uniref:DUF4013 domain-containing protein n=1 Tax=Chryseobacterium gilvum TaxID=2976534 RepID=A0ABT2W0F7_9FLAO|nr:hypothetical protein [Chryseobacterium gilvum]MCU7614657.1 hypothetical protein [Chryseobacterium gilvum]